MVNATTILKLVTSTLLVTSITDLFDSPTPSPSTIMMTSTIVGPSTSAKKGTITLTSTIIVQPPPPPPPLPPPEPTPTCGSGAPSDCHNGQWGSLHGPLRCDTFSILLNNGKDLKTKPFIKIATSLHPDGEVFEIHNCKPDDFNRYRSCLLPHPLEIWTGPKWCRGGGNADGLQVLYDGQSLDVPNLGSSACQNTGSYEFFCTLKWGKEGEGTGWWEPGQEWV